MKNFEFDPYIYQLLHESDIETKLIVDLGVGVYINLDPCNMHQVSPDRFWLQLQRKEGVWLNIVFDRSGSRWRVNYKYTQAKLETPPDPTNYLWNPGQIVVFEIDMP